MLFDVKTKQAEIVEFIIVINITILLQVFLQHLNPLLTLPTFTALWLTILDFMDKYMHIGKRDLLVSTST